MSALEKAIEQLKTEGYTKEQIHKALKIMFEKIKSDKEEDSK